MNEYIWSTLSKDAKIEVMRYSFADQRGALSKTVIPRAFSDGPLPEVAAINTDLLNEASDYNSSFSRAVVIKAPTMSSLLEISGTASIGTKGETLYPGDFVAQLWRTFNNITGLLMTNHMTWFNVIRTRCYLRDIERDYELFNTHRNVFYHGMGLRPYPASVGIQARLCRSDLLVEIEATAIAL